MDDQISGLIAREAEKRSASMNKTIKALLAQAMGVKPAPAGAYRDGFVKFCGAWSEQEFEDFNRRISDMTEIHPGDWA